MKRNFLLLCTIIVPSFCGASFGEGFNSLLETIFDTSAPVAESVLTPIPEIAIPNQMETVDVTDFQKKIMQEEAAIEQLEVDAAQVSVQLEIVADEYEGLAAQVQWLDEQLGTIGGQQEQAALLEKKWRSQLESLAKERTFLAAQQRAEQREYEQLMRKKIVQSEGMTSSEWGLWRWLFGTQTVSQQLERERREEVREQTLTTRVRQLGQLQRELDLREAQTGALHRSAQDLNKKLMEQRESLRALADARARVQARLEFDAGKLQQQIDLAEQQRVESTFAIKKFRDGLRQWEDDGEVTDDPGVALLDFPLPIDRVVTATFRDPEYKKNLGREHWATDFAAPQGTEILAPADGMIKKVAQNGYQYSYLIVDHGDDLFTVYGHVSDVLVVEGGRVQRGDTIARTGGTPGMLGSGFFTTGPHLHFEVFFRGQHVDPLKFLPKL